MNHFYILTAEFTELHFKQQDTINKIRFFLLTLNTEFKTQKLQISLLECGEQKYSARKKELCIGTLMKYLSFDTTHICRREVGREGGKSKEKEGREEEGQREERGELRQRRGRREKGRRKEKGGMETERRER